MLLFKSFLRYTIVLSLTQFKLTQCNFNANNNSTPLKGSVVEASLITGVRNVIRSEENVTLSDKSSSLDSSGSDKSHNDREFPSSERHKRNLNLRYQDSDYDDYGSISPASGAPALPDCILSRSEFYLSWWVNEDGSLRMPASRPSGSAGFADLSMKFKSEDTIFKHVLSMQTKNPKDVIIFMSVANNELSKLPIETLKLVSISLQYLSLANNNFNLMFLEQNTTFQSWSAFPLMKNLKELDLRNCSMTSLDHDIFLNLPLLEKLFLSHNSLSTLSLKTFSNLHRLSHLDLSFNKEEEPFGYNFDPFSFYFSGLLLEEDVFLNLSSLTFLDLSHSKLKQESVKAFWGLRSKVEQLSLCYTEIPLILPQMFAATNLTVLDLSGNPSLIPNLNQNYFEGLENKLEILVFQASNLKNLSPLRFLKKLRMLDLGNNNINQIFASHFVNFKDLEILDLSSNHISSNWFKRVFDNSTSLKIVNLRKNNINLMTPEMMKDFNGIKFLAIGANNFVCDCSLREFIERATYNAMRYNCGSRRSKRSSFPEEFYDPKYHYDVFLREFHSYVRNVEESYKNMIGDQESELNSFDRADKTVEIIPANCVSSESTSSMTFDFLLLDYSENDYHCIESDGSAKTKVFFSEIAACKVEPADEGTTETSTESKEIEIEEEEAEILDEFEPSRTLLYIYIAVGFPLIALAAVWFWKRKDIKYFCSILKNTLILSFDKDDNKSLLMRNQRRKSGQNSDDYRFDLFVSYSDKDREFVLDQLIPNLEKRSQITICLHERDFQVGLGILENIIQCMDQSRCLLLVVSESFLKSNWCAFEMHLAQHRLIETRREQLILVLLQDIPKARRPRTLSFLMRTKTYIMWPSEDKEELRNVFWKRLKKAIILNNWEPERARSAKPRHSIV